MHRLAPVEGFFVGLRPIHMCVVFMVAEFSQYLMKLTFYSLRTAHFAFTFCSLVDTL